LALPNISQRTSGQPPCVVAGTGEHGKILAHILYGGF